jgi:hypothetical protein
LEGYNIDLHDFSLSGMVSSGRHDHTLKITVVYGPTDITLKDTFFQELESLKPTVGTRWIALGAHDKNNNNINRSRLTFRDALITCDLK